MEGPVDPPARTQKLWDPLLRLFHWLLAGSVLLAWGLGKFGPNVMTWHFWTGYVVIGLLAFRLVWGFLGPRPARFSSLFHGPGTALTYLRHMFRRNPSHWPGHNPIGSLAVIAMLAMLAAQATTGLISDPDDFINVGPLASHVSAATRAKAVGWHQTGAMIILFLVVLHIAAILFYRFWKREDLVAPMITGKKQVRHK